MAIIKSAKKAIRSSAQKRGFNLARKKTLSDVVKNFKKLISAKQFDDAKKLIPLVYQAFDKAAKTGVIKKNTASRKKSRLSALLKKANTVLK